MQAIVELGLYSSKSTSILCSNINSIWLVKNPMIHDQTKHFAIQHHYIKKKAEDGTITVHFILSNDQQVEIFTKLLPISKFLHNRTLGGLKLLLKTHNQECS